MITGVIKETVSDLEGSPSSSSPLSVVVVEVANACAQISSLKVVGKLVNIIYQMGLEKQAGQMDIIEDCRAF